MLRLAVTVILVLAAAVGTTTPAAAALRDGIPTEGAQEPDSLPDEVLVTFRGGVLAKASRGVLAAAWGLEELSFAPESGLFRFRITDGKSVDAKLEELRSKDDVEDVSKNWLGQFDLTPNDPRWTNQWGMRKVKMPAAWDKLIAAGKPGGSTRYITIVDSGVDRDHEDLGYIYGWNFVANNGARGDHCNHGSLVAGTAAAFTNNSKGIAGINYAGPIISAKIASDLCRPVYSAAVEAIEYGVNNGSSVITASWAFSNLTDSQAAALKSAVTYAYNNNIFVVAASGNDYRSNFNDLVPARWAKVVTVGGSDPNDRRPAFANYGEPGLDVSAPAEDIYSTNMSGGYEYASGTSFAVPHVAGTIALLKAVRPNMSSANIKERLWNAADKVGGYNYSWRDFCGGQSSEFGCGRLDAAGTIP
jgi:thermitase